jgi:hypothetical protein
MRKSDVGPSSLSFLEKRKMKKFLIAGSSLAAVAAAGSAGAVDVTLGGSINMGVDFGVGKNNQDLQFGSAFNEVSLSINAAHTTDGGLAFGGGFTMGTAAEIEFAPYAGKNLVKATVTGQTDIVNALWNVSGGGAIDSGAVVSVKINSAWRGLGGTQTLYQVPLSSFTSSNICKLAGRGTVGNSTIYAGGASGDAAGSASGGYLPAGQMLSVATASTTGASASATAQATGGASMNTTHGAAAVITGSTTVTVQNGSTGTATATAVLSKGAVTIGTAQVTSAAIYAGPFMEVMMASSETKMVVGAACLSGVSASDTAFYMNNASKVMTVSNASIYIDGGFGRLTLQSGDYSGGVGAIAGAGDQANIDADGLVVVAQGLGILGANPYLAVDLAAADTLGDLEVVTGGTIDLGGLSAAIDVALDNPDDVFGISSWDLGASYAVGDLSLAAATDSSSDWGLSASMAIAGFAVNTTFGSSSAGDHEKAGITYSVSLSTALNGFGLSIGFDQDLQPAVGLDYDLGGLSLYAGYDAADEGGNIGATLSF